MSILGIDPGPVHVGLAVLNPITREVTRAWCYLQNHEEFGKEEWRLFETIQYMIKELFIKEVAMEEVPRMGIKHGIYDTIETVGVIKAACGSLGIPITMYKPKEVKERFTGNPKADKKEIIEKCIPILGNCAEYVKLLGMDKQHVCDAIATAWVKADDNANRDKK